MDKKIEIMIIRSELIKIARWFKANDWIPNKLVTGEWDNNDPRWQGYLAERTNKREQQDRLNLRLNELKEVKD